MTHTKDEALKEADVLIMAEAHGIDPSTKGLYGFYIDCISNQHAAQPAPVQQERELLRTAQSEAVMPLIGPLLDAWEGGSDFLNEYPALDKQLRRIHRAMEHSQPAAQLAPVQEPTGCQHKRYSVDVREGTGTCHDCGAEGRMQFVVGDTNPLKGK